MVSRLSKCLCRKAIPKFILILGRELDCSSAALAGDKPKVEANIKAKKTVRLPLHLPSMTQLPKGKARKILFPPAVFGSMARLVIVAGSASHSHLPTSSSLSLLLFLVPHAQPDLSLWQVPPRLLVDFRYCNFCLHRPDLSLWQVSLTFSLPPLPHFDLPLSLWQVPPPSVAFWLKPLWFKSE